MAENFGDGLQERSGVAVLPAANGRPQTRGRTTAQGRTLMMRHSSALHAEVVDVVSCYGVC